MTPEEFEQYCLEMTAELMTDQTPKTVGSSIVNWWLMLTSIQYTWRDENLSAPMRYELRRLGDKLATMLLQHHPDAKRLIEAGWDTSLDRYPSSAESRNDAIEFLRGMYGLDETEYQDD